MNQTPYPIQTAISHGACLVFYFDPIFGVYHYLVQSSGNVAEGADFPTLHDAIVAATEDARSFHPDPDTYDI